MSRLITPLLPLLLVPVLAAAPAQGAARVTLAGVGGAAVVDPTYATTLTVSGRGFQAIRNGHGGIYVLFGVVKGTWQPSKGGVSGRQYLTVPDAQSQENAGYSRFVAFSGGDTAESANGGTIAADGSWRTTITVPGGTFTTYDHQRQPVEVDCRVSVCGVITVGAHGVKNARNETFTPVRVSAASTNAAPGAPATRPATDGKPSGADVAAAPGGAAPASSSASSSTAAPAATGPALLEVDRASARPGRVLAFSAEGLVPGSQVSATFDSGRAAVGPLVVGAAGQVAGVLRLPSDLSTGTYELRIIGGPEAVAVSFGVVAPPAARTEIDRAAAGFAVAAAGVLLGCLVLVAVRRKKVRRAA